MSALSELFKAVKPSWSGAERSELTNAVKRLTEKSGGIRGLSRELGIPLTSLNRGIATGFATSRADTLNRLSTAVSDAGTFFEERRKFSTALDFTTYQPGTVFTGNVGQPTMARGLPRYMLIVGTNFATYDAMEIHTSPEYSLAGTTVDEIISASGISAGDIDRLIFKW